jgi:O-succinylbenzoate synthase
MSASRPSTLVLDDDDDWGTLSPLPSGSSRVLSSANLVEFYVFAAVASVAGGSPSVSFGFCQKMVPPFA